jgi:HEXXH motif-containing protein
MPPRWTGATHRLSRYELATLARGKLTARIASKLAAAESSKHRLLVEKVRRRVAAVGLPRDHAILETAARVLYEVEAHSPAVVAGLLALPQIGNWGMTCLLRTASGSGSGETGNDGAPLASDLGYLAAVAAVAALRSGRAADLQVPLRAGVLLLPSVGSADLGPSDPWGIAQVRVTGHVATVILRNRTLHLPANGDPDVGPAGLRWQPIPRLHAAVDGVTLDVALDGLDPFLASLGEPEAMPSPRKLAVWEQRLSEAWQILVRYHREIAEAFSVAVSNLVPLVNNSIADPRSATSGRAFGAIGLSFPRSPVLLAEILVHELHHIALGAIEDLYPLVDFENDEPPGYAPWRDDPRPLGGVLHGCYAYLGLTTFWQQQRHLGGADDRLRSEAEFARWRVAAVEAARRIAASPALTSVGRLVVRGTSDQLDRWRAVPVTAYAERLASEARTEHWTRWRLNHMQPPESTIVELAAAWLSGAQAVHYRPDMDSVPKTRSPVIGPILGYLMELRYRDPALLEPMMRTGTAKGSLDELSQRINEADMALLCRDTTAAVREYTRRLRTAGDISAWIGLATALQHAGPPGPAWVLAQRPELAAAVYSRICASRSESPDPIQFTEWLARCLVPLRTLSGSPVRSP